MIEILNSLQRQPWWNTRFMWGQHVCVLLVLHYVWHSNYAMADIGDIDELIA